MTTRAPAGDWLEVLDPGVLTTIQDRGRRGYAHLGVPRAGALDRPAAELANRLLGNHVDDAVLEVTLSGMVVRAGRSVRVSVTGAPCDVYIDERHRAFAEPLVVPAGGTLRLGPARVGLRSYLAVAGGVVVPPTLGSRSTDTLGGLGPAPLAAGDRLPVGKAPIPPAMVDALVLPRYGRELRITLGPRVGWFAPEALAALDGSTYVVQADSDRIALRLLGPSVAWRSEVGQTSEFPTEPLVCGAVQVPPSGQPLVFLADHPTTGGYPVLGVLSDADLPTCAQMRPGDAVTLHLRRAVTDP